jgi:hypothetical protein
MLQEVVTVRALAGYRLFVTFEDGTKGIVSLKRWLFARNPGVFRRLRDEERFAEAYVSDGAVTWPGELDLAPDAMYYRMKARQRRQRAVRA